MIISEFFAKCKCPGIAFSSAKLGYVSNEQLCLKTTGLYEIIFYFYLVCFTFSISYSVLFHLVCFPITVFFFFFDVLSQAFTKHSGKAYVYIYINSVYDIYILENMNFYPAKNFMTF